MSLSHISGHGDLTNDDKKRDACAYSILKETYI